VRLLVTGASGLLGTVAVLDRAESVDIVALHRAPFHVPGVRAEVVDLTDPDAVARVFDRAGPDVVLHTAAVASIDACERDPELARRVNVDATATVAKLAAGAGARLVHVSTDAVFDGTDGPYREHDKPHPLSVYARTKLASERIALDAHPDALVARVNFFGWSRSGTRSLAEFFRNALVRGEEVTGFADVEFASLYHRDLADALLDASAAGISGVRHVVSSDRCSKYDFGRAVARTFGLDEALVRPGRLEDLGGAPRGRRLSLDSSAFAAALGRPMPTIDEGLARMRQDGRAGLADRIRATDQLEADA
jgi:dTDP-4-dehydrorhamnose reductase